MVPTPIALGLSLCDLVLIEEGTRKVSLIGALTRMTAGNFPYESPPFFAFAALIDGLGNAILELTVNRLDTTEEVHRRERRVRFTDRLRELHVVFHIADCVFPVPGVYQFTLFVDGHWVTQRALRVVPDEDYS
jgi:hypothetical protein